MMTPPVIPLARRLWNKFWWVPLTLAGALLAAWAYVYPYRPIELTDINPEVRNGAAALDKAFGKPVKQAVQYSLQRRFVSTSGPVDVEIRVTLRPMADGLVMREDEWYDPAARTVVYQERFVLFRNLFAVHSRTREVAPVVRDLMGRVGWFNESVEGMNATQQGGTPEAADWRMNLVLDRLSDVDTGGLVTQTVRYRRNVNCERAGEVDGAAVGAGLAGTYPRVSCHIKNDDTSAERRSDYAYLPEYGIFVLLSFQQQGQNSQLLEVKGRYLSFKAV